MKKLILSLVAFLTLGLTTAKAETVTFDFVNGDWGTASPSLNTGNFLNTTFTKESIAIKFYDAYSWGGIYANISSDRLYLCDATMDIQIGNGYLTEVNIDVDTEKGAPEYGDYFYSQDCTQNGNVFYPKTDESTGVSIDSFGSVYVKSISITYEPFGADVKFPAEAPVFTPDCGVVKDKVTISAIDGATIYYTTGDYVATAGVEGMSVYPVGGIAITKPTTITAIVTHPDYENSPAVTSSFIPYDPNVAIFNYNSKTWSDERNLTYPSENIPLTYTENDGDVSLIVPSGSKTDAVPNYDYDNNWEIIGYNNALVVYNGNDFTIEVAEDCVISSIDFGMSTNYGTTLNIAGEQFTPIDNVWTATNNFTNSVTISVTGYYPAFFHTITVNFKKLERAATPAFSIPSGQVNKNSELIIECETPGAEIWYTMDGSIPEYYGEASMAYSEPILLTEDVTINAIAVAEGYAISNLVTANYTVFDFNDPNSEKTATFNFTPDWFQSWNENYQGNYYAEGDNLIKVEMADANGYAYLIVEPGETGESGEAIVKDSKLHIKKGMHITILAGESDDTIVETASSWITSVEFICDNGDPANWQVQHIEGGEFVGMTGNIWIAPEIQTRSLTSDNKVKSVTFKASDDDDPVIDAVTVKLGGVPTSVDEIEAENDAEAVYYNLQGVRVANPEKGIYIVVKGNKATKQVF